ncbi:MAG: 4-(cytidine 5'-diphospho)-2-C-methyl-D-erythritol kinase [Alphaproteobacteria bacterium]|nr:4-(cytidine 5'-diphospho)-2-C-methyl-D-erythritol kinase [Alphaproteobacteria bacterium]
MTEFAPAKLNLYLHVVGRRDDGYHELDSLVAFAGVGDRVSAKDCDDLSLALSGPMAEKLENEPDNLVLKAARKLADACSLPAKAHLTLEKNLPVASGIGGGSADAAAALKALIRLWHVKPLEHHLSELALSLGADVPVCLKSKAVFMSGIGERLSSAPALPEAWLVLANPRIPLATPPVFKARSGPFSTPSPFEATPASIQDLARLLRDRRNDLALPAISLVPAIALVQKSLEAQPGCLLARMSGSGATCFGLFAKEDEARLAAREILINEPGWWVAPAPLIG